MKRNGLTLIELIVVVLMVAMLAAILFPVFLQVREKLQRRLLPAVTICTLDPNC